MSETKPIQKREETDPNRGPDGKFLPGNCASPGRPPGIKSGRGQALDVLDRLLTEEGNKEKLRNALQELFDISPGLFFKDYVMPLLPKESLVKLESEPAFPVRVFFEPKQQGED